MAKRGESRPWRVQYDWSNGVHGVIACGSEDEAEMQADKIRASSEVRDIPVTISVTHREAK